MSEIKVHVAAEPVGLKQLCRFCGYVLSDNEGACVAIPKNATPEEIAEATRPSFWAPGAYVATEGNMTSVVEVEDRLENPCDK